MSNYGKFTNESDSIRASTNGTCSSVIGGNFQSFNLEEICPQNVMPFGLVCLEHPVCHYCTTRNFLGGKYYCFKHLNAFRTARVYTATSVNEGMNGMMTKKQLRKFNYNRRRREYRAQKQVFAQPVVEQPFAVSVNLLNTMSDEEITKTFTKASALIYLKTVSNTGLTPEELIDLDRIKSSELEADDLKAMECTPEPSPSIIEAVNTPLPIMPILHITLPRLHLKPPPTTDVPRLLDWQCTNILNDEMSEPAKPVIKLSSIPRKDSTIDKVQFVLNKLLIGKFFERKIAREKRMKQVKTDCECSQLREDQKINLAMSLLEFRLARAQRKIDLRIRRNKIKNNGRRLDAHVNYLIARVKNRGRTNQELVSLREIVAGKKELLTYSVIQLLKNSREFKSLTVHYTRLIGRVFSTDRESINWFMEMTANRDRKLSEIPLIMARQAAFCANTVRGEFQCCVCFETSEIGYKPLRCDHLICFDCVTVMKNRNDEPSTKCPQCRGPLDNGIHNDYFRMMGSDGRIIMPVIRIPNDESLEEELDEIIQEQQIAPINRYYRPQRDLEDNLPTTPTSEDEENFEEEIMARFDSLDNRIANIVEIMHYDEGIVLCLRRYYSSLQIHSMISEFTRFLMEEEPRVDSVAALLERHNVAWYRAWRHYQQVGHSLMNNSWQSYLLGNHGMHALNGNTLSSIDVWSEGATPEKTKIICKDINEWYQKWCRHLKIDPENVNSWDEVLLQTACTDQSMTYYRLITKIKEKQNPKDSMFMKRKEGLGNARACTMDMDTPYRTLIVTHYGIQLAMYGVADKTYYHATEFLQKGRTNYFPFILPRIRYKLEIRSTNEVVETALTDCIAPILNCCVPQPILVLEFLIGTIDYDLIDALVKRSNNGSRACDICGALRSNKATWPKHSRVVGGQLKTESYDMWVCGWCAILFQALTWPLLDRGFITYKNIEEMHILTYVSVVYRSNFIDFVRKQEFYLFDGLYVELPCYCRLPDRTNCLRLNQEIQINSHAKSLCIDMYRGLYYGRPNCQVAECKIDKHECGQHILANIQLCTKQPIVLKMSIEASDKVTIKNNALFEFNKDVIIAKDELVIPHESLKIVSERDYFIQIFVRIGEKTIVWDCSNDTTLYDIKSEFAADMQVVLFVNNNAEFNFKRIMQNFDMVEFFGLGKGGAMRHDGDYDYEEDRETVGTCPNCGRVLDGQDKWCADCQLPFRFNGGVVSKDRRSGRVYNCNRCRKRHRACDDCVFTEKQKAAFKRRSNQNVYTYTDTRSQQDEDAYNKRRVSNKRSHGRAQRQQQMVPLQHRYNGKYNNDYHWNAHPKQQNSKIQTTTNVVTLAPLKLTAEDGTKPGYIVIFAEENKRIASLSNDNTNIPNTERWIYDNNYEKGGNGNLVTHLITDKTDLDAQLQSFNAILTKLKFYHNNNVEYRVASYAANNALYYPINSPFMHFHAANQKKMLNYDFNHFLIENPPILEEEVVEQKYGDIESAEIDRKNDLSEDLGGANSQVEDAVSENGEVDRSTRIEHKVKDLVKASTTGSSQFGVKAFNNGTNKLLCEQPSMASLNNIGTYYLYRSYHKYFGIEQDYTYYIENNFGDGKVYAVVQENQMNNRYLHPITLKAGMYDTNGDKICLRTLGRFEDLELGLVTYEDMACRYDDYPEFDILILEESFQCLRSILRWCGLKLGPDERMLVHPAAIFGEVGQMINPDLNKGSIERFVRTWLAHYKEDHKGQLVYNTNITDLVQGVSLAMMYKTGRFAWYTRNWFTNVKSQQNKYLPNSGDMNLHKFIENINKIKPQHILYAGLGIFCFMKIKNLYSKYNNVAAFGMGTSNSELYRQFGNPCDIINVLKGWYNKLPEFNWKTLQFVNGNEYNKEYDWGNYLHWKVRLPSGMPLNHHPHKILCLSYGSNLLAQTMFSNWSKWSLLKMWGIEEFTDMITTAIMLGISIAGKDSGAFENMTYKDTKDMLNFLYAVKIGIKTISIIWLHYLLGNKGMKKYNGNIFLTPNICVLDDMISPYKYPVYKASIIRNAKMIRNGLLQLPKDYYRPGFMVKADNYCTCTNNKPVVGMYIYATVQGIRNYAFCNCVNNLHSGLRQRFGKETPPQDSAAYDFIEKEFTTLLRERTEYFKGQPFKTSRGKWLSKYPAAKRKVLNEALKEVPYKKKQLLSKIFVKWEQYAKHERDTDGSQEIKDLKPRIIFARENYNLNKNGPVLQECKNRLMDYYNGKKGYRYVGKDTPSSLGRYVYNYIGNELTGCYSFEGDLVTCETTMTNALLELQAKLMQSMGVPLKQIRYLLQQDVSRCIGMGKNTIYCKMRKVRESGTADTSYGNSEVYLSILVTLFRLFDFNTTDYCLLVSGDDCMCIVKRSIPENVIKYIFYVVNKLGLKPELIIHDNPLKATFFSGRFVHVTNAIGKETLVLIPKIGRFIAKSLHVKSNDKLKPAQILHSVMYSRYKHELPHVPILGALCGLIYMKMGGDEIKPVEIKKNTASFYKIWETDAMNESRTVVTMNDRTWLDVAECYGCGVDELKEFRTYLLTTFSNFSLEGNAKLLKHHVLTKMVNIDI